MIFRFKINKRIQIKQKNAKIVMNHFILINFPKKLKFSLNKFCRKVEKLLFILLSTKYE